MHYITLQSFAIRTLGLRHVSKLSFGSYSEVYINICVKRKLQIDKMDYNCIRVTVILKLVL